MQGPGENGSSAVGPFVPAARVKWGTDTLQSPLLAAAEADTDVEGGAAALSHEAQQINIWCYKRIWQSITAQLCLAGPLTINLMAANALGLVQLGFVSRTGSTQQIAAVALGNNVSTMLARLVILGLVGALDTQAAQANGAGNRSRLPCILQRCVLFLWAHCLLLSCVMLAVPWALAWAGSDPTLAEMLWHYILAILPSLWIESVSRPLSRVLVASGVTTPQMLIALVELPLNIGTSYLLILHFNLQYVGAALAVSAAALFDLVLLMAFVIATGMAKQVLGTPSKKAFKRWPMFAHLAYPAAFMKCSESYAFILLTLAASWLPNPSTAVAVVGIAYDAYGVLFIPYIAFSAAACSTVGNRLGAGRGSCARLAAISAVCVSPLAWSMTAISLLIPECRAWVVSLFTVGPDKGMQDSLSSLLHIVALLILLDGTQATMAGAIQGCGQQKRGVLVNFVSFYVVAVPLALYLGFKAHMGPKGLYLGMLAGPTIQLVCYSILLQWTDWDALAKKARAIALRMNSSMSLIGSFTCGGGNGEDGPSHCASMQFNPEAYAMLRQLSSPACGGLRADCLLASTTSAAPNFSLWRSCTSVGPLHGAFKQAHSAAVLPASVGVQGNINGRSAAGVPGLHNAIQPNAHSVDVLGSLFEEAIATKDEPLLAESDAAAQVDVAQL